MLLWGADLLARKQQLGTLRRARHLFLPLLPGFAFVAMLVMLEPDLGTTCCFMLILLGLLWMVGMPLRYFVGVVAVVAAAVTVLAVTEPYRLARLTAFLTRSRTSRAPGSTRWRACTRSRPAGCSASGSGRHLQVLGAERQHRLRLRDHR